MAPSVRVNPPCPRFSVAYMRNRWYDPNTGRFTQEDPIGYEGGSNLYAYVGNNPVSYSDPFGLCKDGDETCEDLVKQLRAMKGSKFQEAAKIYEATDKRVMWVMGDDRRLDPTGANGDDDPTTNALGLTTARTVYLNAEQKGGDRLMTAQHEALYHVQQAGPLVLPVHQDNYRSDVGAFRQMPTVHQEAAPIWTQFLFTELRFRR